MSLFIQRHSTACALVCFAILIAVFYGNSLGNGFVMDDVIQIANNPQLASLEFLPKVITGCLWEYLYGDCASLPYPYPGYRPVPTFLIFLTYQISPDPWAFHLANLLLFFLIVTLFFYFVLLLTKKFLAAFFAAVIFAAHPLQSAVVNWPSAAPEFALSIFVLLAAIAYLRYRKRKLSMRDLAFVYCFYFFALLSKETAILMPFIILAVDVLLYKETARSLISSRALIRYGLFAIPTMLYGALRIVALGIPAAGRISEFSFSEGIYARITLFARYIDRLVYPEPLSLFHWTGKSFDMLSIFFVLSVLVCLAYIVMFLWTLRKGERILAFGLLWFGIFLAPVVFFLIGGREYLVNDRYAFMASAGLALAAGYILARLARKKAAYYYVVSGIVIFVAASWLYIFPQNLQWKDNAAMLEHVVREYPKALLFRFDYAVILGKEQGDFLAARKEFEEIALSDPHWEKIDAVYKNIGDVYMMERNFSQAEAYFQKAIEASGAARYDAINNIGMIYIAREEYERALPYFCASLEATPGHTGITRNILRTVEILQGQSEEWQDIDSAEEACEVATP